MILLVNNSHSIKKLSMIVHLRKSLQLLNIPYYETKKLTDELIHLKGKIKGIIFSGSDLKFTEKILFQDYGNDIRVLIEFDVPVLGLCFGCQLLTLIFGGSFDYFKKKGEYTRKDQLIDPRYYCENNANILLSTKNSLFQNFYPQDLHFCFSQLPKISKNDGVKEIAWFYRNKKKYACGFEFRKGKYYGLMFHPEYDISKYYQVFLNFIKICKEYEKSY
jgi:GMP synthase-like glutamine amidotransferase